MNRPLTRIPSLAHSLSFVPMHELPPCVKSHHLEPPVLVLDEPNSLVTWGANPSPRLAPLLGVFLILAARLFSVLEVGLDS